VYYLHMRENAIERAQQSLKGLCVGDAFGETLFCDPIEMQRRVDKRLISTHRPWRWTDDTAMAISIVNTLSKHGGIDQDALMEAFVAHFTSQPNRGYGHGAFNLLSAVRDGASWRTESQRMFKGQGSFGNGAAMRAAPIGAYFADRLETVASQAKLSAQTTHAHGDGIAGAVAVAVAAAWATRNESAATLLAEVIKWTPPSNTRRGIQRAAEIPLTASVPQVAEELGTGHDVAAHDTVPFCLWVAARHWYSYEDAVWTAAAQNGDRDTLAAIVGGIVVMVPNAQQVPVLWQAATEPLPAIAVD
jgi:ADP-ribosylglycohydrolase